MSCQTGKKEYDSWDHASHDAEQVRRKYHRKKEIYPCRKCGKFHVGGGKKTK